MIFASLLAILAMPFLGKSQGTAIDDMSMASLNDQMEQLGKQMDDLGDMMDEYGKEMDVYGKEMDKYGKEVDDNQGPSASVQQKMNELSEKMNALGEKMGKQGDEMGKLGDLMGKYGEKIGQKHQDMVNWFFREMKKDGLISSLNGNVRIIFDEKGLNVDGEKASDSLYSKYKSGLEKHWGKTLKPDFLFFFKGKIKEESGKIELDGNMNTDF